jgi:hypothetical protein
VSLVNVLRNGVAGGTCRSTRRSPDLAAKIRGLYAMRPIPVGFAACLASAECSRNAYREITGWLMAGACGAARPL